jgi:hypothetical protein
MSPSVWCSCTAVKHGVKMKKDGPGPLLFPEMETKIMGGSEDVI